MKSPQQALTDMRPAFRNLFEDEKPDLARFLRLVILVFDPARKSIGYRGSSEIYEPSRIVLTCDGTSTIGHCKAESDSGVIVTDEVQ